MARRRSNVRPGTRAPYVLTVSDFASLTGHSRKDTLAFIKEQNLPARHVGREYLILTRDAIAWLEARPTPGVAVVDPVPAELRKADEDRPDVQPNRQLPSILAKNIDPALLPSLTVTECAAILRISVSMVRRLISCGLLVQQGRRRRIPPAQVAWIITGDRALAKNMSPAVSTR
jgi:hypothetical protein